LGAWLALLGLQAAAVGTTADALGRTLYMEQGDDPARVAACLRRHLLKASEPFVVSSQSYWHDAELRVKAEWASLLQTAYGISVQRIGEHDGGAMPIDAWFAEELKGAVRNRVMLRADRHRAQLILANATYLRSSWQEAFDPARTTTGAFTDSAGTRTNARMMHGSLYTAYGRFPFGRVLEVYGTGPFSTVFVLPTDERWPAAALDDSAILESVDKLQPTPLEVAIPRCTVDFELSLRQPLQKLSPGAFGARPDFTRGIDGFDPMGFDFVQATRLVIDENGSGAPGGTARALRSQVGRTPIPPLTFDRPFLVIVRDTRTRAVLFWGRIVHIDDTEAF
jgi:serpin B